MADSADPLADVVLWKGYVDHRVPRLDFVSGDPARVGQLCGESIASGRGGTHPLFANVTSPETTEPRQRWLKWLDHATTQPATQPLTLRYPLPADATEASGGTSGGRVVIESVWIDDHPRSNSDPDEPLRVAGHLLIPQATNIDLADRDVIRARLHKVNNDLSIVSMVLEVIALKLQHPIAESTREQLLGSADNAREAIRRSGQIVSAIQKRLRS